MENKSILEKLIDNGIFAVVRMTETNKLIKVVDAIVSGGIKNIEITMTVPNAVEMIETLKPNLPEDVIIGAGTVLTAEQADRVIKAGVKFIVSPVFVPNVVGICKRNNIVVCPGSYTPGEILTTWNSCADIVKVFPATTLGTRYFKDILSVMPFLKIMPTGGVTIDNVGEWLSAGACAVGIGSDLISKELVANEQYDVLTERAKKLVNNFTEAKLKL